MEGGGLSRSLSVEPNVKKVPVCFLQFFHSRAPNRFRFKPPSPGVGGVGVGQGVGQWDTMSKKYLGLAWGAYGDQLLLGDPFSSFLRPSQPSGAQAAFQHFGAELNGLWPS